MSNENPLNRPQCADSAPHRQETQSNPARALLTQDTKIARHQTEPVTTPLKEISGKFHTLLSEKEAARRIGVSSRTLERERFEGKLAFVRIRKRVFYTPEQLDVYIEHQHEQHIERRND